MIRTQKWALRVVVLFQLAAASLASASPPSGYVVAWGDNSSGQTTVPLSLTDGTAIAGGGLQSFAVNSNGTVTGWGTYYDGSKFASISVPDGLSNVISMAAGAEHALALRADRTVVAWGTYFNGSVFTNLTVPTGLTNVVAVAAGGYQGLALRANGTVTNWGTYFNGSAYVAATNAPSGLSGVMAIAAGNNHCLALKSNHTVVAWGTYFDGTGWVPMTVPAGLSNIVAIAAGSYDALALRSNGTVAAWGTYYDGSVYRPATNMPAGLTNVIALAAGGFQSLALKSDKTVVAWGIYYNGSAWAPATVPTWLSNVVAIAAGYYHGLAITLEPLVLSGPPPVISMIPGAETNLNVSVWSRTPFTSQWCFNGSNIAGATGTTYSLSQFDPTNAGTYALWVTNQSTSLTATTVLRMTNSPILVVDGSVVAGGSVARTNLAQIAMFSMSETNTHIYYTLDGSPPDLAATPYLGPFMVTNSVLIRAIAYDFAYTSSGEGAPVTIKVWPIYPLNAATPGGGTVSNSPTPYLGPNFYLSNSVVTLTATTNSGWTFIGWTNYATGTTDSSNVTIVVMDQPQTVQAQFGTALSLFTNGNGQVLVDLPGVLYPYGATVHLTALPAAGSYFFGWANAASGFNNPLGFSITTAAPAINALFGTLKSNQVSLTVLPNGAGVVSNSSPKNVYTNGESVTLTALPATNHVFAGWGGDASGQTNQLVVVLDRSKLITAAFVLATNPPVITRQPLSRTLSAGSDSTLSFQNTGDPPFSYQWRLNGAPVPGATNSMLVLKRVSSAQAGLYDVIVTGPGGATNSAAASVALLGLEFVPSQGPPLPLLILDGAPGTRYRLETSAHLAPTNWTLLAPITLEESEFFYLDEPAASPGGRFYRAVPQ